ncbi:DUF4956 domain-containing protein [Verrucomicrobiota bacterium]
MGKLFQQLTVTGDAPLSLVSLLMNMGVGILLALVLRWHFRRFGSTLSNREEFAHVFPFILLTTVLIIFVVKSSLALSLGLVGALSIVRFRTPIKEPEELAYLFIAIGMGLGLGADQTVPTVVAGLVILGVMALLKWSRSESGTGNLYLSVDWKGGEEGDLDSHLAGLNEVIARHVSGFDLRRFDVREKSLEATYLLDVADSVVLSSLADELRRTFPGAGITFLDQSGLMRV